MAAQRRSALDLIAPLVSLLGVLALAFGLGFLAARFQVFPYNLLTDAEKSARGVWEAHLRPPPFDRPARGQAPPASGAVVHDAPLMAPGLTFLAGHTATGYRAWLVDEEGVEVHGWDARFSEVFPEASHVRWAARDEVISWHGVHLFPNGDVLFNFQDASFPYGGGLVRLDKDSNVLWTLPLNTHHDVLETPDGNFWVPSQEFRDEGVEGFPDLKGGYYEDQLLLVSPEGEVLRELSILDALRDLPGALNVSYTFSTSIESEDPTHLNNVELVTADLAPDFPGLDEGDLVVSLRNLNALLAIDGETGRGKKLLAGRFVQQHDPDLLPGGTVLVYDNRGADPGCGKSRVVELDWATSEPVWSFEGCGVEAGFYSEARGEQAVLENGNVLVVESQNGRLLEVTKEDEPKLAWEYRNVLGEVDGETRVGLITHAQRYRPESLTFLGSS